MPKPKTVPDLELIGLEVQLYLADRYNLAAPDTALVFTVALAETIAYSLNADVTVDTAVESVVAELKRTAQFRRDNPPALGLRELIAEYRRTGGKTRPN